MDAGKPRKRRPGDGNDFDGPSVDPHAEFLGRQAAEGNAAGADFALVRLCRWLLARVKRP